MRSTWGTVTVGGTGDTGAGRGETTAGRGNHSYQEIQCDVGGLAPSEDEVVMLSSCDSWLVVLVKLVQDVDLSAVRHSPDTSSENQEYQQLVVLQRCNINATSDVHPLFA